MTNKMAPSLVSVSKMCHVVLQAIELRWRPSAADEFDWIALERAVATFLQGAL